MSSTTSVTIIGATGGCGLALLRQILASPTAIPTTLLLRPGSIEKLLSLLSIPALPAHVHVVTGTAQSAADVSAALLTAAGTPTSIVYSGLGFVPSRSGTPHGFGVFPYAGVDNAHVCEAGTRTLLDCMAALRATRPSLAAHGGQLLIAVSTTGISPVKRDVPLLMVPLYRVVLAPPHADKRRMEALLSSAKGQRWVVPRPSLLTGDGRGAGFGVRSVRVGIERAGKVERTAVGMRIDRADVGAWIWEEIVKAADGGRKWEGAFVGLTY